LWVKKRKAGGGMGVTVAKLRYGSLYCI